MTIMLLVLAAVVLALLIGGGVIWIERAHLKHPTVASAAVQSAPPKVEIDAATAERLKVELETSYRQQIQNTTSGFATDLSETSKRLSTQVERLTTDVISTELEQYQQTLEQVRGIASAAAQQLQTAVAQQQADLQKALEDAVAAERDRRLAQIDSRLSEIISSYLVESLGAGVDLGAQADYIVAALESHKEDIKKDLASGV